MRVTFVVPTVDYSGGNRVIAIHAAGLRERGHEVSGVVPRPLPPTLRDAARSLVRKLGAAHERPAPGRSHVEEAGFQPLCSTEAGRVLPSDVPDGDVLVATWWETAEWVLAMPATKGAKTYFVQHHEVFDYTPRLRVQATYRSRALKRIAVAPWLVDKLARDYGDPNVALVPNAVDHSVFFAEPRSKRDVPAIGFQYSSAAFKGLEVAVAALRRLRKRWPAVQIHAFGSEDIDRATLQALEPRYTRQPAQCSLKDIYAACDVWLSTSHSEGFGLPALEAMACRTPVVSTRTGWPAQAIVDGVNGYLAEPGDDATLARHLSTVLTLAPLDWRRMSQAAYSTASPLHWDQSTSLFEAALMRAAGCSEGRHAVASAALP